MKFLSTAVVRQRHWVCRCARPTVLLALLALVSQLPLLPSVAAIEPAMMQRVRERALNNFNDPVAWRLFGKALLAEGQPSAAAEALERAARLDPSRAAVHFDLAQAHAALGQHDLARQSLERVIELAPESDFARDAARSLSDAETSSGQFRLASFEPSWVEAATGDPPVFRSDEALAPYSLRLETGVLFNSNVDLAPISRQLSATENGGFQAFIEPDIDFCWQAADHFTAGLKLAGFFAFNQPDNSEFNLQHYEPGIYAEFPFCVAERRFVPQLSYDFSYDIFAGDTLGTRHELSASVAISDSDEHSWTFFWAGDVTDFRDDGDDPPITSLDGPTQTIGLVRKWQLSQPVVDNVRLSVDGQWAGLDGANQAYRGALVLLSSTCVLSDCWELRPELGVGYRVYPDFTGAPSRDEAIWRGGVELRRWLTDSCYLSATGSYDRFDSENDEYAAERFTAGLSATMLR